MKEKTFSDLRIQGSDSKKGGYRYYDCVVCIDGHGEASRVKSHIGLTTCKENGICVHVVCAWVLDLYYGVYGFDSFTGGLFMASHGALDLGFKVLWSKNEGTDKVLEGTAKDIRKYCFYSKVLLIMLKVLLVVKVPLLCSKVLLVSSEKLVYTASFVRYRTERNFWFSDVKTISYSAYFWMDLNLKCFV
ncbi:hypothetical protein Tco_0779706 [Tanacetum coccineum]